MKTKILKAHSGYITEFKETTNEAGVTVGMVEGYIATWDIDRGSWGVKDQFLKGAFQESIADHLRRNRDIRMYYNHRDPLIGVWKINTVREDDKGLFGIAEVNLDTQAGRDAMALIRQRALVDFSIGFSIDEHQMSDNGKLRTITKATVWEGSIVDEPMNPEAQVTDFKSVVPYQDLPLANYDTEWDSTEALGRVLEFTGSEDKPTDDYKKAFLWYDRENSEIFGSYKLPIADVMNGQLTAVPRAVISAAAAMRGARGGVDMPENDRQGVIANIKRYYNKMELPDPFEDGEGKTLTIEDVKEMNPRELETALRDGVLFSRSAAKYLVSKFKTESTEPTETELKELLDSIKSIRL